jgi:hypothetical protein
MKPYWDLFSLYPSWFCMESLWAFIFETCFDYIPLDFVLSPFKTCLCLWDLHPSWLCMEPYWDLFCLHPSWFCIESPWALCMFLRLVLFTSLLILYWVPLSLVYVSQTCFVYTRLNFVLSPFEPCLYFWDLFCLHPSWFRIESLWALSLFLRLVLITSLLILYWVLLSLVFVLNLVWLTSLLILYSVPLSLCLWNSFRLHPSWLCI